MADLKIKTIANFSRERFDVELEELINSVEDASVQYRATAASSGTIMYTALVIYVEKEKVLQLEAPTSIDSDG